MKGETTFPLLLSDSRPLAASLRSEIITDFDQLLSLEEAWSELEEQSSSATIFQSLSWTRAWWNAFGKHLSLATVVVRDGNGILGILPLLRSGGQLRFVGTPGADYCDCLCIEEIAPEVIATALRALLKLDDWKTCRLANLRDESQFARHAGQLPKDVSEHFTLAPTAIRSALVLGEERDKWIAAMRRKPALKRHLNKLYRSGPVRFRHVETREEAHKLLHTLFQHHIYRRAMAGEYSQFLSPDWREFYRALVDELDLRNQLRFSVLELDGKPVACHLGFEKHRTLVLYKPTFDIDAWELSPGDVLLSELLGYASERKLEEVDFTIGSEQYKEHFTNDSRDIYCGFLDRTPVRATLRRFVEPISHLTRSVPLRKAAQRLARVMSRARASYRRTVHGFVSGLVYAPCGDSKSNSTTPETHPSPVPPLEMIRLSDLTALAIHQPVLLEGQLLQEYRARLRAGGRCYLLDNGNSPAMAWVRRVPLSPTQGCEKAIQADVLYDLRHVCTQEHCSLGLESLEWFTSLARGHGTLPWVCVSRFDHSTRAIVEKAEFEYRKDLTQFVRKAIWQN